MQCTSARLVVNAVKARARDKRVRFGDELIIPITDLVLMKQVNKKLTWEVGTPVPIKARSRESNALFVSEQPLVNMVLVNVILVNVILVNVILVNMVLVNVVLVNVVLVHPSKLKHIDKRVTEGLDDRQEVGGGRKEELTGSSWGKQEQKQLYPFYPGTRREIGI